MRVTVCTYMYMDMFRQGQEDKDKGGTYPIEVLHKGELQLSTEVALCNVQFILTTWTSCRQLGQV